MKQYSFFIDDNIFFLKEIAAQKPRSVFSHFFLANLKKLHDKYRTKFLLNLFKGDQNSGFMLDEFPGCYKFALLHQRIQGTGNVGSTADFHLCPTACLS